MIEIHPKFSPKNLSRGQAEFFRRLLGADWQEKIEEIMQMKGMEDIDFFQGEMNPAARFRLNRNYLQEAMSSFYK